MNEAALMLIIKNGLILSVSRKDNHNIFGLIGGKLELNETAKDAAVRETYEETGIMVHSCEYFFTRVETTNNGDKFLIHCFYALSWSGNPSSKESKVEYLFPKELTSSPQNSGKGAFPEYNTLALKEFRIKYPNVFLFSI